MLEPLKALNPSRVLLRLPVPWVYVFVYLVGAGLEFVAPLPFRSIPSHFTLIVGVVLFASGTVIAGWAWALFHTLGTTRVPGQFSTALVTSGPYRVSRNPMYVGLGLVYLGEAAMLRQVWPVVLLPLLAAYLNWTVIPLEEARLQVAFQRTYDEYCLRVRRWL